MLVTPIHTSQPFFVVYVSHLLIGQNDVGVADLTKPFSSFVGIASGAIGIEDFAQLCVSSFDILCRSIRINTEQVVKVCFLDSVLLGALYFLVLVVSFLSNAIWKRLVSQYVLVKLWLRINPFLFTLEMCLDPFSFIDTVPVDSDEEMNRRRRKDEKPSVRARRKLEWYFRLTIFLVLAPPATLVYYRSLA